MGANATAQAGKVPPSVETAGQTIAMTRAELRRQKVLTVASDLFATKGFEATRYSSLLVKEGAHIHHQPALDKFNMVATQLGFDPKVATKVFAVSNEKLLTNFENYRDAVYAKHRGNSAALFKKEDWKTRGSAKDGVHRLAIHLL